MDRPAASRIIIEYLTTDVANGHRFVRDHKQHVRWLIDEQEWRVWDGRHWRRYKTDEKVIELAKKTVRTIYQEAVAMEADPLRKWATRSHGSERLSAMVKMAKSDQQMWSEYKELSTRTRICSTSPTARGDLRTSTLKAHGQQDMIPCLVPHTYNPHAQAPLWERLIYPAHSATGAARPLGACPESSGTCWSATTSSRNFP
jgi:putative DNA primase/helicase